MKVKKITDWLPSQRVYDVYMLINVLVVLLLAYILQLNFNTLLMSWMFYLLMLVGARVYRKNFKNFMQQVFSSPSGSILVPLHLIYVNYFANTVLPSFFLFHQSPYVLYASSIYLGCFLFHCLTDMIERNLYFLNSLILGLTGFLFSVLCASNKISELSLSLLLQNASNLMYSFITMGLIFLFFQLIKLYGKLRGYTEVIGFGDIILFYALSFWFTGYFLLITMMVACFVGALYGIIYSYIYKIKNTMALTIGFAPFLFIGTMGASYLMTHYKFFCLCV